MRHDASAPEQPQVPFTAGDLVVVDDTTGVWRVERVTDGGVRCFSYGDGRLVVVPVDRVHRCPDLKRAAP